MAPLNPGGLPTIFAGGELRVLARLPTPNLGQRRLFSSLFIPRSQWKEVSLRSFGAPILDQNGHGSCVGHGSCTAFDYAWRIAGQTVPPAGFSACFLYGLINGGSDNGANVGDALDALKSKGIATLDEVPEGMVYQRQFPQAAFTTAQRFKILEAEVCSSFDAIGTAIMLGHPVSFGCSIGNAFNPDSQGVIPNQRGGGGGHCMCAMGIKFINGVPYLEVQNSWGTSWGAGGWCYMPESYFSESDNWCVVADAQDPQDPNVPPHA